MYFSWTFGLVSFLLGGGTDEEQRIRNHSMAPIAMARHKIGKRLYGNVLMYLQATMLPRSDSSVKRRLHLCSEPAQHFPPPGPCQGMGSNRHTTENWGRIDELKRWILFHVNLDGPLVLMVFQLCPCFFPPFSLFLAHLQEFVYPAMNLLLQNYS